MDDVVLLGLLVLGLIVLTPLAERIEVPQPVLLTVYGLVLGLVPHVPAPDLAPDLILPLVLPPLLFAATQTTTVRELRQAARPVLGLAVGLTLLTAAAVAVVGHALGLPWAVAVVLGGVVAPPDPVAASAVAGRLHLPARLVSVLEGEGQFNDATALVVYQVSVMAVVAGGVSVGQIGWALLLAVAGGLVLGLVGGWLARWALGHLHDPAAETTVTIALPFALYVVAEQVQASGVLAVLVAGLFLRARVSDQVTSAGWLLGRSVWQYVEFAVSGLLFAFLGVELTSVLEEDDTLGRSSTWTLTGAVLAVLVLLRVGAMFTASAVAGHRARRAESATPAGWREAAVTSWAGMRGVVTVATALALPASVAGGGDFPHRQEVVTVALVVVIATLVLQGLTLAPLIRGLGVASDADPAADVRHLHHLAAGAGLRFLTTGSGAAGRGDRREPDAEEVPAEVRRAVVEQYEGRLHYREAVDDLLETETGGQDAGQHLRRLLARASEAEREAVLQARRRGEVGTAAAEDVLFDIEARALRYEP
ncbi:cation:proton antiporter [Kineococcus rhizosphaerae]|uniref:Sodium/proton antiporter (CPA1 family) n=1 Tax=Kineococcus rhizosphaerae TaxID=559628 RepID=A0A2T0QWX3_9ACTN|nr:cation:proton antiporter [Kineococcus rhizosphaerae]PRY10068.1 sodium/proton antiporter (CPA1 family) [Kineococcus rhizosphaerae]